MSLREPIGEGGAGPCEPVHAGCLSDPLCGDDSVLSNGKCALRLRMGAGRLDLHPSLVSQHFSRDNRLLPVCIPSAKKTKKKSHIQASSLVPARLTFSRPWQGALGVRPARLSSGFSYCCYSVAYSRNKTLLLPQPPRPGHNLSVRHERGMNKS